MRKYLLLITTFLLLCTTATAQMSINKGAIKAFAGNRNYAPTEAVIDNTANNTDNTVAEKAYGIRVYDDTQGAVQQFVSFDINATDKITQERDLSDYYIRAAAEAEGYYYMINSRDGLCAYDLLAMDMKTLDIDTIASYDITNYASAIIFLDMTYDATTKTMYGIGYDLETVVSEDDETVDVQWALVKVDLTSGDVTNVGTQGYCNILTVAADAEGYLWGLDNEGNLWDINKRNGKPGEAYGYTLDIPSSLQSMTFNPNDGNLYWAGFKADGDAGKGFFSKFRFTEDAIIYENIGSMSENAEIIGLYIDPEPIPGNRPASVSQLVVTPAAEGAAQATVSWVNPSTLINGETLANGFKVNIYRNGSLVKTLTDQTAGAQVNLIDENVEMGLHEYMVVCANDEGEGKPCFARNIFIGRDTPNEVSNLKASKIVGENSVTVTWEKPLTGKNNGWYDESSLTYRIVRKPDNKVMAEATTETTVTDTDFTTLKGYSYEITASTIDGKGVARTSNTVVVGPALDVPYECNFATDEEVAMWSVLDGDNDGHEWFASSYSSTGQTFMKYAPESKYNPETPTDDWLITPPLRLKAGVTYTMTYEMFLLGPLFPVDYDITIGYEATSEAQSTVLQSTDSMEINMAFEPKKCVFTVAADGEYYLGYHIRNAVLVQITNVVVRELEKIDLAIETMTVNNIANVNSEMSFLITVNNMGANDIEGYNINIYDENDNLITKIENAPLLESQEVRQHTAQWTPQEEGTKTFYATVEYNGDERPENNKSQTASVLILQEGDWAHIRSGNALMNYAPFIPSYKYSCVETLYYNSNINYGAGTIKGLIFYTYVFNNQDVKNFNATILLANSTLIGLDGNGGDNEAYEEVFSGLIKPTPTSTSIYIPFDKEFTYTGGNLLVRTRQSGQGNNNNLMFYGSRHDGEAKRMWYYANDSKPYESQQVTFDTEISNVSFFMVESNAVQDIENDKAPQAYLSHSILFIDGEYERANIYSIDGRLCATHNAVDYIDMSHYNNGIYIVEVINNNARSVSKVALSR